MTYIHVQVYEDPDGGLLFDPEDRERGTFQGWAVIDRKTGHPIGLPYYKTEEEAKADAEDYNRRLVLRGNLDKFRDRG